MLAVNAVSEKSTGEVKFWPLLGGDRITSFSDERPKLVSDSTFVCYSQHVNAAFKYIVSARDVESYGSTEAKDSLVVKHPEGCFGLNVRLA